MEVGDQQFAFKCEKCKKIIAIPSEYHISKVLDLLKLCQNNIEKFVLLLGKDVMRYEYIDSWGKLKEKLLAKERFFHKLNNKAISNYDYKYTQRV